MSKEPNQPVADEESASKPQKFLIGGIEVVLQCPPDVMRPSAYSELLAECIPDMDGGVVVDLGTGSGCLAGVALLRGASEVHLTDITPTILRTAKSNIEAIAPQSSVSVTLASSDSVLPDPLPPRVDLIVCNPASLPLPPGTEGLVPYGSGEDGRQMIDRVLKQTAPLVHSGAKLLLAQTSLANPFITVDTLSELSLAHRVVGSRDLPFRTFYNRDWIDGLGGQKAGLYFMRDGVPYERVDIFEITPTNNRMKL